MAATESKLGKLHELLADAYINELKGEEITPALLTSVAKFLKDNGIEAVSDDPQMQKLAEEAGNVLDFPFDPKEATA